MAAIWRRVLARSVAGFIKYIASANLSVVFILSLTLRHTAGHTKNKLHSVSRKERKLLITGERMVE